MVEQRIINDRYELGELIGRGGMADVYMAKDIRLGRSIAIKMMRPDLARDPQFQSRFRREAQASAALNHPNIVAVFDTDEEKLPSAPDRPGVSCPYMVMEYVSGETLRQKLRDDNVTDDNAIEWTRGVLDAVAYSHQKRIVHRDIKPANVMIDDEGAVKVMDFGIARALSDSSATMTQTQAVVGTAQYLSPEQARGELVDFRSDLYSVGCLLFELLTGRPPFVGDSPVAVAYQHVREEPPAPSTINTNVSPALDSVLFKALTKDKEDRFQTAEEFSKALSAAYYHGVAVGEAGPDDDATRMAPPLVAGAMDPDAGDATQAMPSVTSSPISATAHDTDDFDITPPEGILPVEDDLLDQDEEETEEKERKGSKRGLWAIVILLLIAGLAAGGWYFWDQYQQRQIEANQVEVPDVTGMDESEALNTLAAAGLFGQTQSTHDDDVPAGEVISTDPPAGTTVQRNDEITVRVSLGADQVEIPEDLAGASEATVRDRLEQLGLQVSGITEINSATVERDRLVDTDPSLGSRVPYGSTVTLKMSTGNVQVPDVTGMKLDQAQDTLSADDVGLNYQVTEIEVDDNQDVGRVLDQTPSSGQHVAQRSTIELRVGVRAEPSPSPTPSPTMSRSEKPSDDEDDDD